MIRTWMPREYLETLVMRALERGYTMEAINLVIEKLNIEVREVVKHD
jgi:hypothetical protein